MRLIIRLIMGIMDGGITKEIKPLEDGKFILKMNKVYGVMGILSCIMALFFIVIGVITGGLFGKDSIYVLIIFALFFLIGLFLVLYSYNTKVEVNSEKLIYRGFTGKIKEIQWNQVENISFNVTSRELILKSNNIKVKLPIHLKGMGSLINIIKKKVKFSIYEQAFEKMGVY